MSWFIPYAKLDNDQMLFLENIRNDDMHYLIKGYAGAGKSVLLVHSFLVEKEKNPDSNIIIVTYTRALIDMIKSGLPEQYKHTKVVTYYEFQKMYGFWDLVLVDEVQDLPVDVLQNIKSKSKRMIVAGDSNQSIYDNHSNIEDIESIVNHHIFPLSIIHRISRSIRNAAKVFCIDPNFSVASMGKMINTEPRLVKANSYEEECKWLILSVKEYAQQGYAPAILLPKHKYIYQFFQDLLRLEGKPPLSEAYGENRKENYNLINIHLESNGLNFQYLGNGAGSFEKGQKESMITVMTYHSAKGLDFKAVFIPFLTSNLEIWRDDIQRAKTLFFVALTRSREQLFLSYNREKHPFINEVPQGSLYNIDAESEIKRLEGDIIIPEDDDEPMFVF